MNKRSLKDLLYEQVARVGSAVASPKRLELLEVLAQGEKTVEQLAGELSIDIKLASAHLKRLKAAHLVASRRSGKHVVYQLSGHDVALLWVQLRQVAEEHLLELHQALERMVANPDRLTPMAREQLLAQARLGEIIVIDVRPKPEYDQAHLPCARSMPLSELVSRLAELPRNREIVAYCRGPFCLMADEALQILKSQGRRARKLSDGVCEWQAAGLPLESTLVHS
ncbi:MAG: ArsR family transcriptional regulator [Betaproteobacteria bacterium]|nr:ArsR family transcriptional regulator [Betaproteobacteria bacterium]MDE2622444.1 ArsR family transcriptional regulator [Betaproteobacteria bacterium]